jgi:hypothetical protein
VLGASRWIRRWHEAAITAARVEAGTEGQDFEYLGLQLHVPPDEHWPWTSTPRPSSQHARTP